MYEKDGVVFASPFERWNLPKRDLSQMKKAESNDFHYNCPYCGSPLNSSEEYEVDGKKYPICVNEYLNGTPDGTIHNWEEIHKCEKCGKESYFSNGCF